MRLLRINGLPPNADILAETYFNPHHSFGRFFLHSPLLIGCIENPLKCTRLMASTVGVYAMKVSDLLKGL